MWSDVISTSSRISISAPQRNEIVVGWGCFWGSSVATTTWTRPLGNVLLKVLLKVRKWWLQALSSSDSMTMFSRESMPQPFVRTFFHILISSLCGRLGVTWQVLPWRRQRRCVQSHQQKKEQMRRLDQGYYCILLQHTATVFKLPNPFNIDYTT